MARFPLQSLLRKILQGKKVFIEGVSCGENSKLLEVGCVEARTLLYTLAIVAVRLLLERKRTLISLSLQLITSILSVVTFQRLNSQIGLRVIIVETNLCIFTLSAVPNERMLRAIKECFAVLKPDSLLLFRDYGLYDMTMLRFEPEKRIGFREYVRSDVTLSYFFCLDTVRKLFTDAGFIEVELENCCVKAVNRGKNKTMYRVWVHGKFQNLS